MPHPPELPLHEEVLLLALKDREGTPEPWTQYQMGVAAALFAELLLQDRLRVVKPRWGRKLVEVVDATPTGDPALDWALAKMAKAKRRAAPARWVQRLASRSDLRTQTALSLCRKKVLRAEEKTVLWLFRRKTYPERDPKPEERIVERLRRAITNHGEVDDRTVVLLSIAKAGDLLKVSFEKSLLKRNKKRITSLVKGELAGQAAKNAIDEAQAAITAAVIASTAVTS